MQLGQGRTVAPTCGVRTSHGSLNPPAIVLDLQMPDMDGIEVLRQLAELRFAGGILLLSGEDERVLQEAFPGWLAGWRAPT